LLDTIPFAEYIAYMPESPEAALARLEVESEAAFKAYRTAYYRRLMGELKTNRALDAAREDMETAIIRAGNAYRAFRQQG
jgi:hypothetical protein